MSKRKETTRFEWQEIKKQAKQEPSMCIRKVLAYHINEKQEQYNKTTGDHRYLQGALHALEGFLSDIERKS